MIGAETGWAVLAGAGLGVGVWLAILGAPRVARPRLELRVAAQLLDVSEEARALVGLRRPGSRQNPYAALVAALRRGLERALGGGDRLRGDLRRAGFVGGVDRFRGQQAVALLAGAVIGAVLALVGLGSGALGIPAAIALPATGVLAGVVGRDRLLAYRIRRRRDTITSELPTILEFLALSLSAGEGIHDAVRRVAHVGSGELATEFRGVIALVAAGHPLGRGLEELARDLQVPPLTRAVDQLVAALDRGAPLAAVLQAQAVDCREQSTRQLLELAGKKEVGMMVPLVFLILPFTIAVAVFPGLVVLQTGF